MYNCIYVSEKERAVDRGGLWINTVDREEREIGGGSERVTRKAEGRKRVKFMHMPPKLDFLLLLKHRIGLSGKGVSF